MIEDIAGNGLVALHGDGTGYHCADNEMFIADMVNDTLLDLQSGEAI